MIDSRNHTYVPRLAWLMIGYKKGWNIQLLGICKLHFADDWG
jgi:hypothetical protein